MAQSLRLQVDWPGLRRHGGPQAQAQLLTYRDCSGSLSCTVTDYCTRPGEMLCLIQGIPTLVSPSSRRPRLSGVSVQAYYSIVPVLTLMNIRCDVANLARQFSIQQVTVRAGGASTVHGRQRSLALPQLWPGFGV
jgi:hypothetical protein